MKCVEVEKTICKHLKFTFRSFDFNLISIKEEMTLKTMIDATLQNCNLNDSKSSKFQQKYKKEIPEIIVQQFQSVFFM